MDEFQFLSLLIKSDNKQVTISNKTIELGSLIITDTLLSSYITLLQFQNCVFQVNEILFEELNKPDLSIYFRECSFHGNIYFTNCNSLKGLKFIDTKKISHTFDISGNSISEFYFKNDRNSRYELNGNIDIASNTFDKKINFEYLNHVAGDFSFTKNTSKATKAKRFSSLNASFKNSHLHNAIFSETNFGEEVRFDRMILTSNISLGKANFDNCTFGDAYFDFVNFGESAYFSGSTFNSNAQFLSCKNIKRGKCTFAGSIFEKNFVFNNSEFKELDIHSATFRGRTSFVDTKFRKISISQTTFEKTAFFDNINLLDLSQCDRKTLRSIKQELQRTENRIDFNKFKGYELDAYLIELGKTKWKDRFILYLNSISSNHGSDWSRGVLFTLGISLIFYTLYFISEYYELEVEPSYPSINHFLKGFFKFLIPSYNSPFDQGLGQWFQYFPFIIGKIFITYGIYQTIVSFRKFRL